MAKSTTGARIGVISDTLGHLDPQVLEEFAGVDHIIHAGDIMDAATLEALAAVAPVTAVAGNMDDGKLGKLPREVAGEVGGVRFVVGHKRKRLLKRLTLGKIDGVAKHEAPDLLVCGHDHPAGRRVGGRHPLPEPGVGQRPARGGRRPHDRHRRAGPAGLGVRFITAGAPRRSRELRRT